MYLLNENLTTTGTTISLQSSAMAYILQQVVLPANLLIRRASDSKVEVVRLVQQVSSSDGTILRAQEGSIGLAFVVGDSVQILPMQVSLPNGFLYLGSPALGTTTALHAALALTASPQTGIAMTSDPDVPRQGSVTGNASGIAGTVTFHSLDMSGAAQSEDVALSGTATVYTTKAMVGPVTVDVPAETHAGTDTLAFGVGPALGLPIVLPRNTVQMAFLNNVRESTAPTVTTGASVGANKITLNSALASTPVSLYFING